MPDDENVFDEARKVAADHLDSINKAQSLLAEIQTRIPSLSQQERDQLATELEVILAKFKKE